MTAPAIPTVLCAVDDSDHAPAVAMAGVGLAEHLGARLVIVRVDDRITGIAFDQAAARNAMTDFMMMGVPGGFGYRTHTESRVLPGSDATAAILQEARSIGAGLIVMGTRGRGPLTRAILGSTARSVLKGATVPVAIVPPSDPSIATVSGARTLPRFGILLVPVDLKSDARGQLEMTGLLAGGSPHRPLLLHVVPRGSDHEFFRKRMNPLGLAIPGNPGAKLLVLDGDVDATIVKITHTDNVGVVILGRAKDVAGSIACAVLENTPAVVIVVP